MKTTGTTSLKWLAMLLIPLVLLSAAGCNTVKGAGEDVQATGKAISETADDAEDEIDD